MILAFKYFSILFIEMNLNFDYGYYNITLLKLYSLQAKINWSLFRFSYDRWDNEYTRFEILGIKLIKSK